MKPTDFKKIIKEAVREAIQEELKEILLEAIRAPKTLVRESIQHIETPPPSFNQPTMDLRSKYKDILGETAMSFTSNDVSQPFNPQAGDPMSGNLGGGEVNMDQIMGLLNTK